MLPAAGQEADLANCSIGWLLSAAFVMVPGRVSADAFALPVVAEENFARARAEAFEALDRRDWDDFLDAAERALRELPETADTHAARAEVMQAVGAYETSKRTAAHRRLSARILTLYIEQLAAAYGPEAEYKPGWAPAHNYLAELLETLSSSPPPPPDPAPPGAQVIDPWDESNLLPDAPKQPMESSDVTARKKGLLIGGAVATGVGATLLIISFVEMGFWSNAKGEYDSWRPMAESFEDAGLYNRFVPDCGCVPEERNDFLYSELVKFRRASVGLLIPGLIAAGVGAGLLVYWSQARKRRNSAVTFGPKTLRVRF